MYSISRGLMAAVELIGQVGEARPQLDALLFIHVVLLAHILSTQSDHLRFRFQPVIVVVAPFFGGAFGLCLVCRAPRAGPRPRRRSPEARSPPTVGGLLGAVSWCVF